MIAMMSPGSGSGVRLLVMWRQGEGIQGAPADFMARVGSVPAGTSLTDVPHAGFRVEDLWPVVDTADAAASEPALNLSGANLRGANLSFGSLSKADLSGADLSGAKLLCFRSNNCRWLWFWTR